MKEITRRIEKLEAATGGEDPLVVILREFGGGFDCPGYEAQMAQQPSRGLKVIRCRYDCQEPCESKQQGLLA
jgi:hypothetical protein